jgi:hypothetical protein
LEERASAMQREEQEKRQAEAIVKGRGRLHSCSDSMLLKSATAPVGSQRQVNSSEPMTEGRGNSPESSDSEESSSSDQSTTTTTSSSEEEEEEDEEVLVRKSSAVQREDLKQSKSGKAGLADSIKKVKADFDLTSVGGKLRKAKGGQPLSSEGMSRRGRAGEEQELGVVLGSPRGGQLMKSGARGPVANSRPSPVKSRRRLRSMDTLSTESEEEEEEEMNGVLDGATHRRRRAARPLRQTRSKSSSDSVDIPESTRAAPSRRRSSVFSDSEPRGYDTTLGLPSASSTEDLTVAGPRRGGRKHHGIKRHHLSVSSLEEEDGGDDADMEMSDSGVGGTERISNGLMNGEAQDIKPMELVWAKCRGYPPYPALVSKERVIHSCIALNRAPRTRKKVIRYMCIDY